MDWEFQYQNGIGVFDLNKCFEAGGLQTVTFLHFITVIDTIIH